jgi:hypothetical protein
MMLNTIGILSQQDEMVFCWSRNTAAFIDSDLEKVSTVFRNFVDERITIYI